LKYYGPLIKHLHWCTDQAMTSALEKMELTAAQGRVMGYLSRCKVPPCPKDIEEFFGLSHPTVSGILTRLEKKEFIEVYTDPSDRRCRRIRILPKGISCNKTIHETIMQTEQRIVEGFSPEEKEQFLSLLSRAIINMGGSIEPPRHKEETKS